MPSYIDQEEISINLEQAKKLLTRKEFYSALEILEVLSGKQPTLPDVYVLSSVAYFNIGQLDQAEKNANEALKIAPHSVKALDVLGSIYIVKSQNTLAMDTLVRATTIDPKFWRSHYNMAVLYSRMGDVQSALKEYIRAFLYKPSFITFFPALTTGIYLNSTITRFALVICFLMPFLYQYLVSLIFTSILAFIMITLGSDMLKLQKQRQGFQLIIAGLLTSALHIYLIIF